MSRWLTGIFPVVGLVVLLLGSISLMSSATEDSAHFGEVYSLLLVVNAVGLALLAGLIGWNLLRLLAQVRRREAGARLTVRMVAIFVLLSLTPVLVVYYFSLQTLHRGIESWFDLRIESALDNALELGKASLGMRMREQLRLTENMADSLATLDDASLVLQLAMALDMSGASELTVVDAGGAIIASTSVDPSRLVPTAVDDSIIIQVRQSQTYVGLDPVGESGLNVRAVAELPGAGVGRENRYLHALFPVTERINSLAQSVQEAYAKYRELAYLREPLKFSFTLTLSLVLLLSVFAAAWSALFSARRMVAPLQGLAAATHAVADGDYETRLDRASDDELGFLVASFNDMTRRLRAARDETRLSQTQVEGQRAYLEAVLARMSSGVITIDDDARVVTANHAAAQILGIEGRALEGIVLGALTADTPHLGPLLEAIEAERRPGNDDWRTEVHLFGPSGRQVLVCRGTALHGEAQQAAGHVVVFDDLTALIQAERNAAWGEVARRLAHEIKNPLTPIQLSAERLRHKYLARMDAEEGAMLDRLTRTIVNQVEAMKEMVNAFSAYARSPQSQPRPVELNALVLDVSALYGETQVCTRLGAALPNIQADPDRLRQLLHNLIKNALEARTEDDTRPVEIVTRLGGDRERSVELRVRDHGPGIPDALLDSLFEPYVTSKPRGTGLGLAIVKKIAEEHGGMVTATNEEDGGATLCLRLPALAGAAEPRSAAAQ